LRGSSVRYAGDHHLSRCVALTYALPKCKLDRRGFTSLCAAPGVDRALRRPRVL
jgi:hypothetical protein